MTQRETALSKGSIDIPQEMIPGEYGIKRKTNTNMNISMQEFKMSKKGHNLARVFSSNDKMGKTFVVREEDVDDPPPTIKPKLLHRRELTIGTGEEPFILTSPATSARKKTKHLNIMSARSLKKREKETSPPHVKEILDASKAAKGISRRYGPHIRYVVFREPLART